MKMRTWRGFVIVLGVLFVSCDRLSVPGDAPARVQSAVAECGSERGTEKQNCYERLLLAELDRTGVGPTLDLLSGLGAVDVDVAREGHVYTHAIGIQAYSPGEPVADVFGQCSTLYQSGCYHGVIQAHFIAEGSTDAETLRELCAPYEPDPADRWLLFQCLHGLGHGLTMYYGHDLPRALNECDHLTNNWNRESCYGGAFMENVVNATSPHHPATTLIEDDSAVEGATVDETDHDTSHDHAEMSMVDGVEPFEPLRADDPQYPCSILESRYLTACYMMQTSAMLWHNGNSIRETAKSCGEAPEAWRATCFQSLGRDISSRTLQDPDDSLRECGMAPEDHREWCYVGLVKNFVDLTATTDAGFGFCARVEDWAKSRCHEAMGEEIGVLHGTEAERRTACAVSETVELERACLHGARVSVR